MRLYFMGPRMFGGLLRLGVSADAREFRGRQVAASAVQGCFVYVIEGEHGRVKIGISTNPSARLATLQTGSPFALRFVFIGATPGNGFDIEQAAHSMLARFRVSGEWFLTTPAVAVAAVQSAAFQIGQKLLPIDDAAAADRILRIASQAEAAPSSNTALNLWILAAVLWSAFILEWFLYGR